MSKKFLPLIFFILLLSPIGAPALYVILASVGLCTGGLGSGVECSSYIVFPTYFQTIGSFIEISLLVGIGILWILLAGIIFLKFIKSIILFRNYGEEKITTIDLFGDFIKLALQTIAILIALTAFSVLYKSIIKPYVITLYATTSESPKNCTNQPSVGLMEKCMKEVYDLNDLEDAKDCEIFSIHFALTGARNKCYLKKALSGNDSSLCSKIAKNGFSEIALQQKCAETFMESQFRIDFCKEVPRNKVCIGLDSRNKYCEENADDIACK